MKNKFILINLIIIAIISISTVSLGFSINMEMDKTKDLKVDDEVILTLNLSEKIVGASFKINYDRNSLKLLDKESENLYVSENNGKVACVYIDMEEQGTDNLKIKFKVLNTDKTDLNFSLEEAKFVTLQDENSYSGNNIIGISKTITIEKTSNNKDNDNTSDNTNNNQGNNTNTNQSNNVNNNNNNGTNSNIGNTSNSNTNNMNNNNSTNNKNNNSNKKDNTTVNTSIPKTGTSDIIFIFIGMTILSIIYFGIKLKNISK